MQAGVRTRGDPLRIAGPGPRRRVRGALGQPGQPGLGKPDPGLHETAGPACGPRGGLGLPPADDPAGDLRRAPLRPPPDGEPPRRRHERRGHAPAGGGPAAGPAPGACRPARQRVRRRGAGRGGTRRVRAAPADRRAVPRCPAARAVGARRHRPVPGDLARGGRGRAPLRPRGPGRRRPAAGPARLLPAHVTAHGPRAAWDTARSPLCPAHGGRVGAGPGGGRRAGPGRCRGPRAGRGGP